MTPSKEIENYIPFYLGCKYKSLMEDIPDGIIVGFSVHPEVEDCCFVDISFIDPDDNKEITIPTNCFDEIKPILRHLSDITSDEVKIAARLNSTPYFDRYSSKREELKPEVFRYLLSIGIDLFGLIESGFAVDKTKLK